MTAGFEGGGEGAIAAALTLALGSELTHPATEAAAEAETPAIILRRVRKNMMEPNRKWVSGILFL
jgi:hypothetical protein